MKFIKTTEYHHIFKDENNNTYKVNISAGTHEEALILLTSQSSNIKMTYKELRKTEYDKLGLTPEYFCLCLIQKELDNDSTLLDEYQAKRLEIKNKYPK